MDLNIVLRAIAFIGAIVVGLSALTSLRAEWKKRGLDDQVTKVLLALLALGCIIVIFVAIGVAGRQFGAG